MTSSYGSSGRFKGLCVEKIRLTGGEPLLRGDLPADLSWRIKRDLGVADVALTTNGWFLGSAGRGRSARPGWTGSTSPSTRWDEENGGRMNGLGFSVSRVLAGIDAAAAAGFPIKINCVVQRGVNEGEIISLCEYFREQGPHAALHRVHGRGQHEHWSHRQVVTAKEIVERVSAVGPWSRWALPTGARSRRATDMRTAGARSAS